MLEYLQEAYCLLNILYTRNREGWGNIQCQSKLYNFPHTFFLFEWSKSSATRAYMSEETDNTEGDTERWSYKDWGRMHEMTRQEERTLKLLLKSRREQSLLPARRGVSWHDRHQSAHSFDVLISASVQDITSAPHITELSHRTTSKRKASVGL